MQDLLRTLAGIIEALPDNNGAKESMVFATWRSIAGANLAGRAIPILFKNGTLTVAVADRTWQRNLEEMSGTILGKLNSCFEGKPVKFIRFTIDATAAASGRSSVYTNEATENHSESRNTPAEVSQAASSISNSDLRRAFEQAAVGCLARNRP